MPPPSAFFILARPSETRGLVRIGIFGTGDVGQVLGSGLVGLGHDVMLGSRSARNETAVAWCERSGDRARTGTFAEAAGFAELAVVATRWDGTDNALRLAQPDRLATKVVIDATNPLVFEANVPPQLALGCTTSGGEMVQHWLPGAHVVKALNTTSYLHMVQPQFDGGPPDMLFGGNDIGAKDVVGGLLADLGWNPIDLGGIEVARYLEPLAMITILHALRTNSWNHAFKLLSH